MSATNAVPESSIDLTGARFARALGEEMDVERTAPLTYQVHHNDETYAIDLQSASCTCPDAMYRSPGCKHSIVCALHALFTDESRSQFTAQVAQFAREQGCVHDVRGCAGPTATGPRGLPCQQCIDGVRAPDVDEYTVWCALNGRDC